MAEDKPELLTPEELAARLAVAPGTVKEWARRGRIPSVRISPKVVRFYMPDVVGALREEAKAAKGGEA